MNVQVMKIAKSVVEHVARNSGKYLVVAGAVVEAMAVGAVAYFKGKNDGRPEGYEDASREYASKFQDLKKRTDDIEEKLKRK